MRFKEGDKVEFIDQGELKQGVVTEIKASNFDISYQVKSEFMGTLWVTERDLVAPAPVLKVPQFVADWYEQHRHKLEYSIWGYIYDWDDQDCESDFYDFMKNDNLKPVETLIKMKDGYEVEKEPLYYVKLPYFGYVTNRMDYTLSQSKTDAVMLTESKIKRMDERYWQFAVLVEDLEGEA
ncbi:DUF1642 domain-containing protein [Listeria monocytogenes]|uniref:DUF1642 domain-containing protein n=1 Tax=Listeria monocytogenes TaxID=1639 RepID=UPI000868DF4A|nr:DUF1642 domain-containing protein [Listeria monocytogenes]EAD7568584.1 DUF1642 domain-containing protein [Listeria monocytogenes]EAG6742534.1 DUF1642 domain-containing protein [Listeria monocytogenes]EBF6195901.1 DUF1642 domain-containing protein [Listeria monocytogenes]OEQ27798.1 hypothetical protein AJN14_04980 [Listeria monocytogenes]